MKIFIIASAELTMEKIRILDLLDRLDIVSIIYVNNDACRTEKSSTSSYGRRIPVFLMEVGFHIPC